MYAARNKKTMAGCRIDSRYYEGEGVMQVDASFALDADQVQRLAHLLKILALECRTRRKEKALAAATNSANLRLTSEEFPDEPVEK